MYESKVLFLVKKEFSKKSIRQQQLFEDELLDDMLLEGYAQFINSNKHNSRIMGFFSLDCIGDPVATKENYKRLKALTDAKIYPVWQITDSIEELDHLVAEEPEMIGIGGCVRFLSNNKQYVRGILEKITKRHLTVNFHALGIADEMLQEFRIFSADSTAYLNARKWNDRRIYLPNGERVEAPISMSTIDIIKYNLRYLIGLEQVEDIQTTLMDFNLGA